MKDLHYYKITARIGIREKDYYIAAETQDLAISVVKGFDVIKRHLSENTIKCVDEISKYDFILLKKGYEKRLSEARYFKAVVFYHLPKLNKTFPKDLYLVADSEEEALRKAVRYVKDRQITITNPIKEINEISKKEYIEHLNSIKNYKVEVMFGHVGVGNTIIIPIAIRAKSKDEAAEIAKELPKVKKTRNCCSIVSVEEIDDEKFAKIKKEQNENHFLNDFKQNGFETQECQDYILENTEMTARHKRYVELQQKRDSKREELLRLKSYKRLKKDYALDAGRHLLKHLKYSKNVIFEVE